MLKKTLLGSFDAERFWRPVIYSRLPALVDENASRVVACMDELLFPLCKAGDLLLTRFKMNSKLKEYLWSIGFRFDANSRDLQIIDQNMGLSDQTCIFEILHQDHQENKEIMNNVKSLDCYAILPWTEKVIHKYGLESNLPESEVVIRVNSKLYSYGLHDRIGLKKYGKVLNSGQELMELEKEIGDNKRFFLIKDTYGVSGKGNILITSAGVLNRVAKHLIAQEEKGLATCFIAEPLLDKKMDFSCQINIDSQGTCRVLSIQTIYNNGFSYLGSMTATEKFRAILEKKGYFEIIHKVAVELYKDGYFGDVCIDSMLLKNDEIAPLIEINARKSMGLINHFIDEFLSRFSLKGFFIFFSMGYKGAIQMDELLDKFEAENLLFSPDKKAGVIPLSSNTLFINRDLDMSIRKDKLYKGRLYLSVVSNHQEEQRVLMAKIRNSLKTLGFNIYN
jgi:hypothetical protein